MTLKRLVGPAVLLAYAAVPFAAFVLIRRSAAPLGTLLDVLLATVPMVLLAAVTWRLFWPRWKLVAKLVLHPCVYALLSVWIGHWSILVAWLHQGRLGLGGHIWFSARAHTNAEDLGMAGSGTHHPEQQPDRRGLARAIEAEKPVDLAPPDLEARAIEGRHLAESFRQLEGGYGQISHAFASGHQPYGHDAMLQGGLVVS